ncbi:MAG: type II toxin-antitoxin system VapC family toxin [Bryobacteraceae bacterium]|jgi:tRNA(fMet)-specific endonuclease VapC
MRLMLETSAYSAFMRGHPRVEAAIRQAGRIVFRPIVLGELQSGFLRGAHSRRNQDQLETFLGSQRVSLSVVDRETSLRYAEILRYLQSAGIPIPTNDIWIAAGAMQYGLRVITTDGHFLRIPQILVEFCGQTESN